VTATRSADDVPIVRGTGLVRHHGSGPSLVRAVDGVDIQIGAREYVVVTGPSGCGKSTLLHLLGGLDRPTAGQVHLLGQRVDDRNERAWARLRRHHIGFVFQSAGLVEGLSVLDNILLAASVAGGRRPGGRPPS